MLVFMLDFAYQLDECDNTSGTKNKDLAVLPVLRINVDVEVWLKAPGDDTCEWCGQVLRALQTQRSRVKTKS